MDRGINKNEELNEKNINIAELIEDDYIIVCDTNIFLGLYRISPDFANFALDCLKRVQTKVILPYTVKVEYYLQNNSAYNQRLEKIEKSVSQTIDLINNQHKILKNNLDAITKRQFPDFEQILREIDEKYESLTSIITNYFQERAVLDLIQDSSWSYDIVKEFLDKLLANEQVMIDFDRDMIYRICVEGKKRYSKKIPPGFKDSKDKDGISKYSDLILWKEIINYAKQEHKNIIFVTDDRKPDWWRNEDGEHVFLDELVTEFENKSGKKILPLISIEFYKAVSESMDVPKSNAIEQFLDITTVDYIKSIYERAFEEISDTLSYSGFDYIDESVLSYIGSTGVEVWEIDWDYDFIGYSVEDLSAESITYELTYSVNIYGSSADYAGRDSDTKEFILFPRYEHGLSGDLTLSVIRKINLEDADDYDTVQIAHADFYENSFETDTGDDENDDLYSNDSYTTCPDCSKPINNENDGGNGFCIACAPNH